MTRVIFIGTPDFAVPSLQKLIATQTVVGVVTQPDRPAGRGRKQRPSPVKVAAAAAGIPVYQPKSLRKPETAVPLHEWQPDVIIVAAFGQILRPHVLELPPHGCLNVHASLLPRWRGASPIQHAIIAGDNETGITLMQMDRGLDTGPIYIQEALPIHADETAVTLHDRLAALGAEMVGQYLNDIVAGHLTATAQDDALSTYAPMIKKEAGRLDWGQSSAQLDRLIRAMTPWPGAFTTWQGQNLKILTAQIGNGRTASNQPGQINEQAEQIIVATGDGHLVLQTIQLAGKRAMSATDFARGRPEFVGALLGN